MAVLAFVSLLIGNSAAMRADSTFKHTYGVYAGANWNSHSADFAKLAGIPNCCPIFESGSGTGFNLGALYEFSKSESIRVALRAGILTLNGQLQTNEATSINLPTGPALGTFVHRLDGTFTNLGIEPRLLLSPFQKFYLTIGGRIGFNVTSTFSQTETLNGPGTFLDSNGNDTRLRTRNEFSGNIPNAKSFQLMGLFSAAYELPLNSAGNLRLVPEATFYSSITQLVEKSQWKVWAFNFGISIKYSAPAEPKIEYQKRRRINIDTITVQRENIVAGRVLKGAPQVRIEQSEEPGIAITTETTTRTDTLLTLKKFKLSSSVVAVAVDENGNEIVNPVIRITEYTSNRLDPLLNYVFFAENSSEIPARYVKLSPLQISEFEIDNLFRDSTLDIYYSVLNIIGLRMIEISTATLRLIGCNAGVGIEKDNLAVSRARAEAIRDYLRDFWKIHPSRLKIEVRGLPATASIPIDDREKAEENRRVELVSDDERVTESVYIKKIDRSTNLPIIRFKANALAEAGLQAWTIKAGQLTGGDDGFVKSGVAPLPTTVDWVLEKDQKIIPQKTARIRSSLSVTDSRGLRSNATDTSLQVEIITLSDQRLQHIDGFEVEKFSLILFDFDKANIEGGNLKVIDVVKKSLRPKSEVEIVAYTDRTGQAAHNTGLSQRRAQATRTALGSINASVRGVGADVLLFDNDLPEGRFYCRTVTITVKSLEQRLDK
ncbi:MAG: hypothetical protein HQ472_06950 [Ignavibacteria bacterium]|nr:hypothetical protein [Ignavibacteria bacterium]